MAYNSLARRTFRKSSTYKKFRFLNRSKKTYPSRHGKRSYKNRGQQRTQVARIGINRGIADVTLFKMRTATGISQTLPLGQFGLTYLAMQMNNANSVVVNFGPCAMQATLSEWYTQYRVTGQKIRFTYYPDASITQPICAFIQAGSTNAFPTLTAVNVGEQRWAKSVVLKNVAQGASPSRISVYYDVNKVFGPDRGVRTDQDFVGSMSSTPPVFGAPPAGPFWTFGLYTMEGIAAAAAAKVVIKVEITTYMKLWGKRALA